MTTPGGGVLFEWIALARVHAGGVILADDDYVQDGYPITGRVADMISELIEVGLLALGTPDPRGHRTVCVTVTGQARYAEWQRVGDHG